MLPQTHVSKKAPTLTQYNKSAPESPCRFNKSHRTTPPTAPPSPETISLAISIANNAPATAPSVSRPTGQPRRCKHLLGQQTDRPNVTFKLFVVEWQDQAGTVCHKQTRSRTGCVIEGDAGRDGFCYMKKNKSRSQGLTCSGGCERMPSSAKSGTISDGPGPTQTTRAANRATTPMTMSPIAGEIKTTVGRHARA
jgi:hypothetical protein